MKTINIIILLGAIGMVAVAGAAMAAGEGPNGGTGTCTLNSNYYAHAYAYGDQSDPNWYKNMTRWSNAPAPQQFKHQNRVVAPPSGPRDEPPGPRPNGPLTPADVQALVQEFQHNRELIMEQQRVLEQQLVGAGEQERQRLGEQLKEQMEQWKQQQAQLREQLRDQCDRLSDQLREHNRVMERISNPGTSPGGGPGGQKSGGARGR